MLRSLARDPAARFRSAEELRASLLAVDSDNDEVTPPAGVTVAAPAPRRAAGPTCSWARSSTLPVPAGGGRRPAPAAVAAGRRPTGPGRAAWPPRPGALAAPKALPATSFDPFGDDKVENQASVGARLRRRPEHRLEDVELPGQLPEVQAGRGRLRRPRAEPEGPRRHRQRHPRLHGPDLRGRPSRRRPGRLGQAPLGRRQRHLRPERGQRPLRPRLVHLAALSSKAATGSRFPRSPSTSPDGRVERHPYEHGRAAARRATRRWRRRPTPVTAAPSRCSWPATSTGSMPSAGG